MIILQNDRYARIISYSATARSFPTPSLTCTCRLHATIVDVLSPLKPALHHRLALQNEDFEFRKAWVGGGSWDGLGRRRRHCSQDRLCLTCWRSLRPSQPALRLSWSWRARSRSSSLPRVSLFRPLVAVGRVCRARVGRTSRLASPV